MTRIVAGLALLALSAAFLGGGQDGSDYHAGDQPPSLVRAGVPLRLARSEHPNPEGSEFSQEGPRPYVLRIHSLAHDGIATPPEPVATT